VRIKKGRDGPNVFVCTRDDGTLTMQHQRQAFFAGHDLTHFALEEVLPLRAFYSLLAEGWELDDFGPPWPRGAIPLEAEFAERVVGLLDLERATNTPMSAAEVNGAISEHYVRQGWSLPLTVTDEQLAEIRRRRGKLLQQWERLAPGETLELDFSR
jgi:hypothetical protein